MEAVEARGAGRGPRVEVGKGVERRTMDVDDELSQVE